MGFMSSVLKSSPEQSLSRNDWTPVHAPVATHSGARVSHETALNYSAVWAATRLLTETIASLPRHVFRHDGEGGKAKENKHPLYKLFHTEPNPDESAYNCLVQQTAHLINWGNWYSEIERDATGRIVNLWPIHPSRIFPHEIERDDRSGELVYQVRDNHGGRTPIVKRDAQTGLHNLLHIPGALSDNGITGKGVIHQAAESIGAGMAVERFGAAWFANGANPSVVIKSKKKLSENAQDNLRSSWRKRYQGAANSGSVLVLEEESDLQPFSVSPEASQFLETRQFSITEIARWYNVPPHLLGDLSKATFSNIEEQNISYVLLSIVPWVSRIEQELNRQLVRPRDQGKLFHKFMLQGLLRGNSEARANFYTSMFNIGAFSVNDILELEDRNPIGPDGDKRFVPLNMTTLDQAGEETEEQEPEAEPEIDEPEDPGEDEQGDESDSPFAEAARHSLCDAIQRMLNKESNAIRRRMGDEPARFELWKSEFYPKHEATFRDSLAAFSGVIDVETVAKEHCRDMLGLYDSVGDGFGNVCEPWATAQARELSESLLEGLTCQ